MVITLIVPFPAWDAFSFNDDLSTGDGIANVLRMGLKKLGEGLIDWLVEGGE